MKISFDIDGNAIEGYRWRMIWDFKSPDVVVVSTSTHFFSCIEDASTAAIAVIKEIRKHPDQHIDIREWKTSAEEPIHSISHKKEPAIRKDIDG